MIAQFSEQSEQMNTNSSADQTGYHQMLEDPSLIGLKYTDPCFMGKNLIVKLEGILMMKNYLIQF